MLWTIVVVLGVPCALALVSPYSAGGVIHLLLVLAMIGVVFRFLERRQQT